MMYVNDCYCHVMENMKIELDSLSWCLLMICYGEFQIQIVFYRLGVVYTADVRYMCEHQSLKSNRQQALEVFLGVYLVLKILEQARE